MTGEQIPIPDFSDALYAAAQTQATELGLAVHIAEGEATSEEPRVERNADGSEPGTVVSAGTSVGVVLYPHEPRQ